MPGDCQSRPEDSSTIGGFAYHLGKICVTREDPPPATIPETRNLCLGHNFAGDDICVLSVAFPSGIQREDGSPPEARRGVIRGPQLRRSLRLLRIIEVLEANRVGLYASLTGPKKTKGVIG